MELYLNKPFSVENNKNAFNIPNPAYIKGAQHLKKKEEYGQIHACASICAQNRCGKCISSL